jgi:hypothetical protein
MERRFGDFPRRHAKMIAKGGAPGETAALMQAFQQAFRLDERGRLDEAARLYESVLAADADHLPTLNNLALLRLRQRRPTDAVKLLQRVRKLAPGVAEVHSNLGAVLSRLNRHDEAIASFKRALALKADWPELELNLGNELSGLNRQPQALAHYARAIALKPDLAAAHFAEALALLTLGDLEAGWRKYEWRFPACIVPKRDFLQPLWLGEEDIAGRTILLHAEQGYGDAIQFLRYVKLVARRGARVVLEVPALLAPLIAGLDGVSALCTWGEALPPVDLHTPLMSLPLAFGTTLATIPVEKSYLRAPAARVERWQAELGGDARLRVGLAWAGSATLKNDHNRSMPLRLLLPLLDLPGVRFFSLQKELRAGDDEILRSSAPLVPLGERLVDFADTAAVIAGLDLVIAVDTAVAHLAGALGKPVWVLLPFAPEWRWLLKRDDSPWYPSARLFRQREVGNWPDVVARARKALERLLAARGAGP